MLKEICFVGAAAVTLGMLSHIAQAETMEDDPLLATYGEFTVGQGQTKTLAYGKHERLYRICVRTVSNGVPLRVEHDGLESLVFPGDCADVEGMQISVSPGDRLAADAVVIGQYRPVD